MLGDAGGTEVNPPEGSCPQGAPSPVGEPTQTQIAVIQDMRLGEVCSGGCENPKERERWNPGGPSRGGLFQLALDGEEEGLPGSRNSMGKDIGAGEHGGSWASLSGVGRWSRKRQMRWVGAQGPDPGKQERRVTPSAAHQKCPWEPALPSAPGHALHIIDAQ